MGLKNATVLWLQKQECTFHNVRKKDFDPSHHEEVVNMWEETVSLDVEKWPGNKVSVCSWKTSQVKFLPLPGQLTVACNFSSRESNAFL